MTPAPTPVVIAVLSSLPAVTDDTDRVSTTLLSPLPAIRVTKVGDAETPSASSIAPLFQVEVWAEDELDAERIAWRISDDWPAARREAVRDAVVHGRWVEISPRPLPDAETGHPRYLVTVGLRLSGAHT